MCTPILVTMDSPPVKKKEKEGPDILRATIEYLTKNSLYLFPFKKIPCISLKNLALS